MNNHGRGRIGAIGEKMRSYARACVDSHGRKRGGGCVRDRSRTIARSFACVLAFAIVLSAIAAPLLAAPASAASPFGPSGMVGLPDAQISENVPQHARDKIATRASDLQGSVMTDRGASTLEVEVTTRAHARGAANANPNSPIAAPTLALNFTDSANHAGRRVTLPVEALKAELGYVPRVATVYHHTSGEEYAAPITVQGGLAVFRLNEFSTNTVTFDSRVSINATGATAGSSWSYNISDLDAVSNLTATVTGASASENDTESGSGVSPGSSVNVNIAGNMAPGGPANGDPELTVNPNPLTSSKVTTSGSMSSSGQTLTYTVDAPMDTITGVRIINPSTSPLNADIGIDVSIDGTKVGTTHYFGSGTDNTYSANYDTSGVSTVDITLTYVSGGGDYFQMYGYDYGDTSIKLTGANPSSITATADTGETASLGSGGSVPMNLSTSTSSITLDASGKGSLAWSLAYTERQATTDPKLSVNGNWHNRTGTLAAGETWSVPVSESEIQAGTNTISADVSSPTADAPTPIFDLAYGHDAASDQTVSYNATTWHERYNVSKTWASSRESASVTIPFAGNVVDISGAEIRSNGTTWESQGTYSLMNTTLTVPIGEVSAGETTDVRVNGSRVIVKNGAIQVTKPTVPGNSLATEFTITQKSGNVSIDVSGTESGEFVHYLANESWNSPDPYARVKAGGSTQKLYLPNAVEGGSATARTLPLEVRPTNDLDVRVASPGAEPRLAVSPGDVSGDSVEYVWHDTISGEEYVLWSVTRETAIAKATANSPVSFLYDSDAAETLEIFLSESSASATGGGGGGGGGGLAPLATNAPASPPEIVMILAAVLIAGLGIIARRRGISLYVVGPGMVILGLLALETISPGSITGGLQGGIVEIAAGLGQVAPAVGLTIAFSIAYVVYKLAKRLGPRPVQIVTKGGR